MLSKAGCVPVPRASLSAPLVTETCPERTCPLQAEPAETGPVGVHAGREGSCQLGQRDKLRRSPEEERFKPQSRQDSPSSSGEERVCPEEAALEQRPRGRRVEERLGEQGRRGADWAGAGGGPWGASVAKCPGLPACSLDPEEAPEHGEQGSSAFTPALSDGEEGRGAAGGKGNRHAPPLDPGVITAFQGRGGAGRADSGKQPAGGRPHGRGPSPEREGPLLVAAHAVPVDGGGAGHGI